MNQRQNRQALSTLLAAYCQPTPVPSWFHDPHALAKTRRKVERAILTACGTQRPFSTCYPDSTGPDTSAPYRPAAVVLTVTEAAELAKGSTLHRTFGVPPVKRRIIDRRPAIQRLTALRKAA